MQCTSIALLDTNPEYDTKVLYLSFIHSHTKQAVNRTPTPARLHGREKFEYRNAPAVCQAMLIVHCYTYSRFHYRVVVQPFRHQHQHKSPFPQRPVQVLYASTAPHQSHRKFGASGAHYNPKKGLKREPGAQTRDDSSTALSYSYSPSYSRLISALFISSHFTQHTHRHRHRHRQPPPYARERRPPALAPLRQTTQSRLSRGLTSRPRGGGTPHPLLNLDQKHGS